MDTDPLATVWTALDDATVEKGCVKVIPGSHRFGVINPSHPAAHLTAEQAKEWCKPEKAVHIELKEGEAVLLHNWTLHASGVNSTRAPRRAFSVNYMLASTRVVASHKKPEPHPDHPQDGDSYPVVFEGAGRSEQHIAHKPLRL